jgi:hypothetical protein
MDIFSFQIQLAGQTHHANAAADGSRVVLIVQAPSFKLSVTCADAAGNAATATAELHAQLGGARSV